MLLLRVLTPIHLPMVSGATLRGGFGYTFKRLVCVVDHEECARCLLRTRCAYPYVFETPPPPDTTRLRKYPYAPHPFVLTPPAGPRTYKPGETFSLELILIGGGIPYLPYFIYTLSELGQRGLGKGRGQYLLTEVHAHDQFRTPVTVYTAQDQRLDDHYPVLSGEMFATTEITGGTIHLRFLTPTRLKYEERFQVTFPFHVFIRNLLRRLSLLSYFHCGTELHVDFQGLIQRAMAVETVHSTLRWVEQERYSTRQQARMKLGGVVGEVLYRGAVGEFLPLLRVGTYLHIGKATSFGLGKYEMEER